MDRPVRWRPLCLPRWPSSPTSRVGSRRPNDADVYGRIAPVNPPVPHFLSLLLAVLAVSAQLLRPVALPHGLGSDVACGTGTTVNALQQKMLRVAPPELLQALGYAPQVDRQCEQCCSALEAPPTKLVRLALERAPTHSGVVLRAIAPKTRDAEFYDATGPPNTRA